MESTHIGESFVGKHFTHKTTIATISALKKKKQNVIAAYLIFEKMVVVCMPFSNIRPQIKGNTVIV